MGPQAFEGNWDGLERALVARMARTGEIGRFVGVVALAAFFYFFLWPKWTLAFPDWARFNLAQDRTWLVAALVVFGFFAPWVPRRALGAYSAGSLGLAWVWSCWKLGAVVWQAAVFPVYIVLVAGCAWLVAGAAARSPRPLSRWLAVVAVVFGFAACMWAAGRAGLSGSVAYLRFFWLLHPEGYVLAALGLVAMAGAGRRARGDVATLALAPVFVCNALPIPEETRIENADRRVWWRGWWNIALNFLILRMMIGLTSFQVPAGALAGAAFQYLYFCLFVVAGMNVTSGLLRMFGADAPDATRFLFLAATPLEIWKRSSTYMYLFIFRLVYLPVFRATRSLAATFLATAAAVILQVFLLHEVGVRFFYAALFPEFGASSGLAPGVLAFAAAFVGVWAAMIVAYRWTLQRFFARRGWLGASWWPVLATHAWVIAGMAIVGRLV